MSETFALYITFSAFCVIGVLRFRRILQELPRLQPYSRQIASAVICILGLPYIWLYAPLVIREGEESPWHWVLQATVPWAVATLGLPLVLPKLWAATLAGLRDSAVQSMLALGTAFLSYVVFTFAQADADRTIMDLVQTHPNQLAGAQRLLTAGLAIYGWLVVLFVMSIVALFVAPMVETRAGGRLLGFTASLTLTFALYFVPLSVVRVFCSALPSFSSVQEWVILYGSFMPNNVVSAVERSETGAFVEHGRLACRNLPAGAYIAFVHPDEAVPNKVIIAERKAGPVPEGSRSYRYRLAECENTINPDRL